MFRSMLVAVSASVLVAFASGCAADFGEENPSDQGTESSLSEGAAYDSPKPITTVEGRADVKDPRTAAGYEPAAYNLAGHDPLLVKMAPSGVNAQEQVDGH